MSYALIVASFSQTGKLLASEVLALDIPSLKQARKTASSLAASFSVNWLDQTRKFWWFVDSTGQLRAIAAVAERSSPEAPVGWIAAGREAIRQSSKWAQQRLSSRCVRSLPTRPAFART